MFNADCEHDPTIRFQLLKLYLFSGDEFWTRIIVIRRISSNFVWTWYLGYQLKRSREILLTNESGNSGEKRLISICIKHQSSELKTAV